MSNTPSDAEIRGLAAEGNGVYQDDETAVWEITDPSLIKFASAVLAKWGTPPPFVREPQWIDPNNKTQQQYLPHIGEPVLFCHKGTTYYGKHTGASFVSGVGFAQKHFNTWHCHWMYPPAAHDIAQEGGSMALSDEKLWDLWNAQGTDDMSKAEAFTFARAVEAEVRKQDDALIQQLEEALTDIVEAGEEAWGKDRPCVRIGKEAITAARARLGEKT